MEWRGCDRERREGGAEAPVKFKTLTVGVRGWGRGGWTGSRNEQIAV